MPPSIINPAPQQNPVIEPSGLATQVWVRWFRSIGRVIDTEGAYHPVTFADIDAPVNSIYFSSTANKLVYKTAAGVVNALY